ncbi:DUF411 domain-containing protein [Paracoccus liaowanqingii]|uniref:DUF411 domain-containing protein n=1 Tax=Paracoccus liaowanqingii TaxID=2560053 RepID=UPI00197EEB97
MHRRIFIGSLAALLAPATGVLGAPPLQEETRIAVVRSPDCGCCGAWIDHLRESGFTVEETLSDNTDAFKDQHAVPQPLRSCHTALVEDYVIEGHVPAEAIRKLLAERPQAAGLAVPGMPIGSPGMEMGDHRDPFDVILWSGPETRVFASY